MIRHRSIFSWLGSMMHLMWDSFRKIREWFQFIKLKDDVTLILFIFTFWHLHMAWHVHIMHIIFWFVSQIILLKRTRKERKNLHSLMYLIDQNSNATFCDHTLLVIVPVNAFVLWLKLVILMTICLCRVTILLNTVDYCKHHCWLVYFSTLNLDH